MIYFDNNATTPPLPDVVDEVARAMSHEFGNPSSTHSIGVLARKALWSARERVASFLDALSESVVFVSGGTEANNLVLSSVVASRRRPRIVTTPVEHSSVLGALTSFGVDNCEVVALGVDASGRISLTELGDALTQPTDVVSVQWANSETGVIQPIDEIHRICHANAVPLHTDAAQAVGRIHLSVRETPVDFLTFSGHKIHGPKGTGVVYARDPVTLRRILFGGSQEFGLRAGTENSSGLMGLAKACEIRERSLDDAIGHMRALRERFECGLRELHTGIRVNGSDAPRVCNTANVLFGGVDGHGLVAQLDQRKIFCSQTSACRSHRPEPSYVLRAMGLSEDDAYASVRFGFSVLNNNAEVDAVLSDVDQIYRRLRSMMDF